MPREVGEGGNADRSLQSQAEGAGTKPGDVYTSTFRVIFLVSVI